MMSRLCLLATLLCLPLVCFGGLNECRDEINNEIGPPIDGVNNYKAYSFRAETAGECDEVMLTCNAMIPDEKLIGRTWFITNIRPNFGLNYDDNVIQDFRVQCPVGTLLHLFVQNSSLPPAPACSGVDFVRIQATDLEPNGEVTFCGSNDDVAGEAEIYNNGLGRIFADGQANISFCSNEVTEDPTAIFDGFVIRATCLNPVEFHLRGCVDLPTTRQQESTSEFTELIFGPHPTPDRVQLPHRKRRMVSNRRARWALKNLHREKKFVISHGVTTIQLTSADTVSYSGGNLIVSFANGTTHLIPGIFCFTTFSGVIGTRQFYFSSLFDFPGEGKLEFYGSFAWLIYTIAPEIFQRFFLPGPSEMEAANIIYNYIFTHYIFPFPVIDTTERRTDAPPIFPLPDGNDPPKFEGIPGYRSVNSLDFIQEDFQAGGSCKRAMRIEISPSNDARLPKAITSFCQFFGHSCDLTLRVACREWNRLDPLSVGK